jgi:glycogenin glucosyltransferase
LIRDEEEKKKMSHKILDESYVTLATNDNYAIGALTLAASLRASHTRRQLTVLISWEVSEAMRAQLATVFDTLECVQVMNSQDVVNLALLARPDLGITFTKLHCWRLTQFRKCVFLDADCLCVKPVDELFEEREEFSAATDVGWPDCFNSGVFVFVPSCDTYSKLVDFAVRHGSFDGGDQGLLNSYYKDWCTSESSRRLPFIYNMTTNVSYSYAPALKQFRDSVKIVHFIGAQKPWYYRYNLDTNALAGNVSNDERAHLSIWWRLFVEAVLPKLNESVLAKMSTQLMRTSHADSHQYQQGFGQQQTSHDQNQACQSHQGHDQHHGSSGRSGSGTGGVELGSGQHQDLWESGQIEYTGRDSFSNIQAHLDSQLNRDK